MTKPTQLKRKLEEMLRVRFPNAYPVDIVMAVGQFLNKDKKHPTEEMIEYLEGLSKEVTGTEVISIPMNLTFQGTLADWESLRADLRMERLSLSNKPYPKLGGNGLYATVRLKETTND